MYKTSFLPIIFTLLSVVAVVGLLGGCAELAQKARDNDYTIVIVTQIATLKYVEADDNRVDTEKAQYVYDMAQDVSTYLTMVETTTVTKLKENIFSRIDWSDLSPADTVATRAFIDYLAFELQRKIDELAKTDTSKPAEDLQVVAGFIIKIVIDVLRPYVDEGPLAQLAMPA